VNLPNSITVGRIAVTPLIAFLPLVVGWEARLAAFLLFVIAAISDYFDGMFARRRNLITPLGQLLDPLADKLLLLATLIPMFHLMGSRYSWSMLSPHHTPIEPGTLGVMLREASHGAEAFPYLLPGMAIGFPLWILVIVLGRELFMTVFRQAAARRDVIIAAIGLAKWKTGFQSVWVGATYFWFFAADYATTHRWNGPAWRAFAYFSGLVCVVTMLVAVALTVYSLVLYIRRYGHVFANGGATGAGR